MTVLSDMKGECPNAKVAGIQCFSKYLFRTFNSVKKKGQDYFNVFRNESSLGLLLLL